MNRPLTDSTVVAARMRVVWLCLALIGLVCGGQGTAGSGGHWAFQPVRRAVPPVVPGVLDPVDCFIAARLRDEGLKLSPPADRVTWLRRVTLDLTGLPATAAAVAAFEADTSEDARERCVEALLASPAYGERWGRWWLDVARYSDTNGQDENKVMANAWRYRDWVVGALNADMPFDRFIQEQVAGDLLPSEGSDEASRMRRWVATGFLVLGPKLLAEQDKPKLVLDIVDEQLDTVGRAVLGLTLGCARCHDHKFDPVPQRDYYAMAGIFRSTRTMENLAFVSKFNERGVGTRAELDAVARHAEGLRMATAGLDGARAAADAALQREWRALLPRVLSGERLTNARWAPFQARVDGLRSGTHEAAAALRRCAGDAQGAEASIVRWESALKSNGAVPGHRGGAMVFQGTNRMERAAPEMAAGWTLAAWIRVESEELKNKVRGETRRWLISREANEWAEGHLALLIDGDKPGAYVNVTGGREKQVSAFGAAGSIKGGTWHHLAAVFDAGRLSVWLDGREVGSAAAGSGGLRMTGPVVVGERADRHVGFRGRMDSVRVFARALDAAALARLVAGESVEGAVVSEDFDPDTAAGWAGLEDRRLAEMLLGPGGLTALPEAKDRRASYGERERETLERAEAVLARLKANDPGPAPMALAAAEDVVTNLPVMVRGNHLTPGKTPVPRGFLSCVTGVATPSPGPETSGRLELARWLTDRSNPLTPRVLVNRVWQAHFGEGLVRTSENFGLRGEAPSHPELLDWLAAEFMRGGWSLKTLHRRLVLSQVYGQTARAGVGDGQDPDNRLLHRFPRQRLDAEMVRDALLSVSGRLDRTMGGTLVSWKNDEYVPGDTEPFGVPRRTLYLPVVRDRGTDLEAAFDGANPSVCVARRSATVVTPQALYLLNSETARSCAEQLAGRVLAAETGDRVGWLYRELFGREPRNTERERTTALLSDTRLQSLELRMRWAVLAQALMASNEFMYRE